MIYFKSVLIGIGTVLLGCVVTPIAMLFVERKTGSDAMTISISPIGLVHSVGFWEFIIVLFSAGFVLSRLFLRK